MNPFKSTLIGLIICSCLQLQSLAVPIPFLPQGKTVTVKAVEFSVIGTKPERDATAGAEVKQEKNPVKENSLPRRSIQVKEVFITTGEVFWLVTEIIVQIIIDNPCLLR